jgi:hypothetical protein
MLLVTSVMSYAEPVPTPAPTPKPSGPMPVPYPDVPPPPVPECPYSLCPKAAATLQFAGGAATIEVESFSWGADDADGPTTANTSDPQEGGQVASRKAGGTQHETIDRATAREGSAESAIPYEHTVTSPRDLSSGQASGKRQHKPIRMRRGGLEVTMPEGVCVAGSHYPAVTLRSGGQAFEMRDVTIASCTPLVTAKGRKDKARLDYMIVKMETVLISG